MPSVVAPGGGTTWTSALPSETRSGRFERTRIDGTPAAEAVPVNRRIRAAAPARAARNTRAVCRMSAGGAPVGVEPVPPYAARYCCHTSGTRGTATCTKIVAAGGAGLFFGCMFACFGSLSPLRRLYGAPPGTMLFPHHGAPLPRGGTWWTGSGGWAGAPDWAG